MRYTAVPALAMDAVWYRHFLYVFNGLKRERQRCDGPGDQLEGGWSNFEKREERRSLESVCAGSRRRRQLTHPVLRTPARNICSIRKDRVVLLTDVWQPPDWSPRRSRARGRSGSEPERLRKGRFLQPLTDKVARASLHRHRARNRYAESGLDSNRCCPSKASPSAAGHKPGPRTPVIDGLELRVR